MPLCLVPNCTTMCTTANKKGIAFPFHPLRQVDWAAILGLLFIPEGRKHFVCKSHFSGEMLRRHSLGIIDYAPDINLVLDPPDTPIPEPPGALTPESPGTSIQDGFKKGPRKRKIKEEPLAENFDEFLNVEDPRHTVIKEVKEELLSPEPEIRIESPEKRLKKIEEGEIISEESHVFISASRLLSIFKNCPNCSKPLGKTTLKLKVIGTAASISYYCPCKRRAPQSWSTQSKVENSGVYEVNAAIAAAVCASPVSFGAFRKVFETAGISCFSHSRYKSLRPPGTSEDKDEENGSSDFEEESEEEKTGENIENKIFEGESGEFENKKED
ncbi:hypothetical protein FO519_009655 [Halicephalobus sp. NKZ332]|nr:hypothetical protein FO519_009655 [Halicephalobus sp. NKZ332]